MPSKYLIILPFIGFDICNSARRNKICQEVSRKDLCFELGIGQAGGSACYSKSVALGNYLSGG